MTAPAAALTDAGVAARSPADQVMCRLLRVPVERPPVGNRRQRDAEVQKAFSTSILLSAARCLLTYVALPFVVPLLGIAKGVGPWLGLSLAVVAIVFNIRTMRRFWSADHRWRWGYTVIGTAMIALLLVLMVGDVADLLT